MHVHAPNKYSAWLGGALLAAASFDGDHVAAFKEKGRVDGAGFVESLLKEGWMVADPNKPPTSRGRGGGRGGGRGRGC